MSRTDDSNRVSDRSSALRIIALGDLHLFADASMNLRGANSHENAQTIFKELSETRSTIDHLLVTGDVSHDGSNQSYSYVEMQLASLALPNSTVPGNHDNLASSSLFDTVYPASIDLNSSWRLHLINTAVPGRENGVIAPSTIAYLQQELRDDRRHHLVLMHHDVLQEEPRNRPGIVRGGVEFLQMIKDSAVTTCLVTCGHRHKFGLFWVQSNVAVLNVGAVVCQFDFLNDDPIVTSRIPEYAAITIDDGGQIAGVRRVVGRTQ